VPGRHFSDVAAAELRTSEGWPSVLLMGGSLGVKRRSVISSFAVRLADHLEIKEKKKLRLLFVILLRQSF